jgi:ABC-type multidrug transport system fused ATPase/permease subunit
VSLALDQSRATAQSQAESHVTFGEALRLIGRAFAYVRPFRNRVAIRWALSFIGLLPVLYVPWPGRLLIDNVVMGQPLTAAQVAHYPPYLQWAVRLLVGHSPAEIALAVTLVGVFTLITFGLIGQGPNLQNTIGTSGSAETTTGTRVNMSDGVETAANAENAANAGASWASGLYGLFEFRYSLRLSQAINHFYRARLFERLKSLPMVTLEERRTGDLIYRVMYDTPAITGLVLDILLTPLAITTFLMVVYVMSVSFGQAPEVIWLALLAAPVGFVLTAPFSAWLRGRYARARIAGAVATHTIEETMGNVFAIQSLGGWRRELERFRRASNESFRRYRSVLLAGIVVGTVAGFGGLAMLTATFFVVSSKIIDGHYSVGDFSVLAFNYAYMTGSMAVLSQLWIRIQDNIVGVRRVFALMDLPSETDQGTAVLAPIRQGVCMEGVGLTFPDGRRALAGVDFEARVGEITAIVGATGAGKTSLAYLVPRFHSPTAGRVLIDGVDIAGVSLESLRRQVTYVFQDTQLFSASVADNIRYGAPHATDEQVHAAASIAGAAGFIEALPEGYDTQLGARGAKLSVGQRQRIAIARGLIAGTPILILDEPTSALDPETETHLVAALQAAAKGKAVIVIAHRLSTVAHADRLVFLREGRVAEAGRPAELLQDPASPYAAFVRLQSQ